MQKFDTAGPVSVVLDIPAGRVRLIASDRGDTTVQVLPSEESKKRDVKAAQQTEVSYADGIVRIVTADASRVLGSSGSLDVTIELPAGSRVEGKAGAAELSGTGRLGEVVFEGGYRQVELEEVASAHLKVHTGEVRIGRLAGPAQIRNSQGDITVAEAVTGAVDLRTESGSIAISAAPGTSATLDAGTLHGRITNTLKNSEGAAAGLAIKATTSNGDITASSL
ncbi:MAG: DUF4097 family beta strand repeat protein [Catenulispora sp.]|nr:DUF4097 family beta strand repeat protein [Catenulispora sp.]